MVNEDLFEVLIEKVLWGRLLSGYKRRLSGYMQNGARLGVDRGRFSTYAKQNYPFSIFSNQ
jgi:hypothetical protein